VLNGRGIKTSVHPPETDRSTGLLSEECNLVAELSRVREARTWLRELLPANCLVRDDCLTVLSELVGNAAEYGRGSKLTMRVTHETGSVSGVLVQHGFPEEATVPRAQILGLLEAGQLRHGTAPSDAEIADLREGGRGLLLVSALCSAWETDRVLGCLVTRWWLHGCECKETKQC
jgi:anti-sigma regulatory factor (Ser/Thr protein kinase)